MKLEKLDVRLFFYLQIFIVAMVMSRMISLSLYLLGFEPFDYFGYAFFYLLYANRLKVPPLTYSDYTDLIHQLISGKYVSLFGISPPSQFSILTLFSIYFTCSCILVLAVKRFHEAYVNPMKAILKGIDYQPSDERTSNIVHEVSNKLRIKPPKVFTTDNIKIIALSAKMNPKENFILISRKVVQQLDSDELKAIIAHECHHIRTDVEEVTRTALGFSRYLAEYPLLFTFVLVICTISYYFFGLFSEEGYFPFFITDLLALSAFYLTLYLVVIFFNPNALFGSLYPHLRELDADLISSFVTRKPRALVSALRTIILMKIVDVRFSSLQFYKPINKEIRIKRWRELFFTEPRITWGITHPSPLRRIKFLKLLHELMNKEVSIKLNKPLTRFLALRIYFPNFVLLWSPWGRRLRRIGEEKIKAVYNYMESNSNNFNLAKCAENLKMDELDVATIFFSFLMRDIVNVIDPAP